MDGGSAYGIGNTMHITGITTNGTSGHVPAVVEVKKIYNNVGDVVRVSEFLRNLILNIMIFIVSQRFFRFR